MKTPILGSAYVARSVNAADNQMINLFPEIIPEGGKDPAFLQRCPGTGSFYINGANADPIRAMRVVGDYLYYVVGDTFKRIDVTGTSVTTIGTVTYTTDPVAYMSDNGTQIFISSEEDGYIYDTGTLAFAQISDPDFPGSGTVTYLNGFFLFNEPDTQKVWSTALLDGTSIEPLNFASAEFAPDNVIAVIALLNELVVLGNDTIEFWYNAGNAGFSFAPIQGAVIEVGCLAAASVAKLDNSIRSGRGFFTLGQYAQ